MASDGRLRGASGTCINEIFLIRENGKKQLIVDGDCGHFIVSCKGNWPGTMQPIMKETYVRLKYGRRW